MSWVDELTPEQRTRWLDHTRWVTFGEEAMTRPFVRCYGWRKLGEEADPKNVVYF